jgi:hypothetical protein
VHHLSTVHGITGSDGQSMVVYSPPINDDHGHSGFADEFVVSQRTRTWVDGELVDDQPAGGSFVAAPTPGTPVRVLAEADVAHPTWTLSTSYRTDWRFLAPAGSPEDIVPADLLNIDYGVVRQLDDLNATGRTVRLDLGVLDAVGEPASGVRGVRVRVSGDGGQTWSTAKVTGTGAERSATVRAPRGATSISLEVEAWTADARVTDTVVDAIGLR